MIAQVSHKLQQFPNCDLKSEKEEGRGSFLNWSSEAGKSGLADTMLGCSRQGHTIHEEHQGGRMCRAGSGVREEDILPVSISLWRGAPERKIV